MNQMRLMRRPNGTYKRSVPKGSEVLFLDYYFSQDSETKGNATQSALRAGYAETTAITKCNRIIKKYGDASAAVSLNAVGINKPYLAAKLKQIMEKSKDKEILAAVRLSYNLMGEISESGTSVNISGNAPVMVIVGASQSRLKALRQAIPQLSPEQQQIEDEAASAERLAAYKRGELGYIQKHSKANINAKTLPELRAEEESPLPNDALDAERMDSSIVMPPGENGMEGAS